MYILPCKCCPKLFHFIIIVKNSLSHLSTNNILKFSGLKYSISLTTLQRTVGREINNVEVGGFSLKLSFAYNADSLFYLRLNSHEILFSWTKNTFLST